MGKRLGKGEGKEWREGKGRKRNRKAEVEKGGRRETIGSRMRIRIYERAGRSLQSRTSTRH